VDESGNKDQSDVFVMAGLLVDAYRLRKHTAAFDEMIASFLTQHPGLRKELKTKRIIDGEGGWSAVDPGHRKKFIGDVYDLAFNCARVFAVAFSFERFSAAAEGSFEQPFGKSYWCGAAMFIAGLVQQKVQKVKRNKGLTVLICDDNKQEMQKLSDMLHDSVSWFDPLYQKSRLKRGKTTWLELSPGKRFDQIVNTAFAIKSHHSSLIQVADAVAYIHRRHLELMGAPERWAGEKEFVTGLVGRLPNRERLGRNPGGPCIDFYEAARHREWRL
jgi:hypothetical protein